MCLGASRRRREFRLSTGVNRKLCCFRWIGPVTVGVICTHGGTLDRVKADEGAERSCQARRKRRGQRRGKHRARVGKTRELQPSAPVPLIHIRRRAARRIAREDIWCSSRATLLIEKVVRPNLEAMKSRRLKGREAWFNISKCWTPFRRQTDRCSSLGTVSLSVAERFVKSSSSRSTIPSWDEIGFGSPYLTVSDHFRFRLTRLSALKPSLDDLFPDEGPISLEEWRTRVRGRITRAAGNRPSGRCTHHGRHRWCDECGGCVLRDTSCPVCLSSPLRNGR